MQNMQTKRRIILWDIELKGGLHHGDRYGTYRLSD